MAKFKKNLPASKNYEKVEESKKEIFINNLIGGIGWAIGATIFGAIIIAILTLAVKKANLIPFIGSNVVQIIDYVQDAKGTPTPTPTP